MSDLKKLLTKINAPQLSGEFSKNLNDTFGQVEENFQKLLSSPYLKGMDAKPVLLSEKCIYEEEDDFSGDINEKVFSEIGRKLVKTIFGYDGETYRGLIEFCVDTNNKGLNPISGVDACSAIIPWLTEDGNPTKNPRNYIYTYSNEVPDGNTTTIQLAQYYYYIDPRLKSISTTTADNSFIDTTCLLGSVYKDDELIFEKIYMFPTIYYDSETQSWAWKVANVETGISASGVKGNDGISQNIFIAITLGESTGNESINAIPAYSQYRFDYWYSLPNTGEELDGTNFGFKYWGGELSDSNSIPKISGKNIAEGNIVQYIYADFDVNQTRKDYKVHDSNGNEITVKNATAKDIFDQYKDDFISSGALGDCIFKDSGFGYAKQINNEFIISAKKSTQEYWPKYSMDLSSLLDSIGNPITNPYKDSVGNKFTVTPGLYIPHWGKKEDESSYSIDGYHILNTDDNKNLYLSYRTDKSNTTTEAPAGTLTIDLQGSTGYESINFGGVCEFTDDLLYVGENLSVDGITTLNSTLNAYADVNISGYLVVGNEAKFHNNIYIVEDNSYLYDGIHFINSDYTQEATLSMYGELTYNSEHTDADGGVVEVTRPALHTTAMRVDGILVEGEIWGGNQALNSEVKRSLPGFQWSDYEEGHPDFHHRATWGINGEGEAIFGSVTIDTFYDDSNNSLYVKGGSTLNGDVVINNYIGQKSGNSGNWWISSSGAASFNKTLNVGGDATFSGDKIKIGNITINSSGEINASTLLIIDSGITNASISYNGNSSFDAQVYITSSKDGEDHTSGSGNMTLSTQGKPSIIMKRRPSNGDEKSELGNNISSNDFGAIVLVVGGDNGNLRSSDTSALVVQEGSVNLVTPHTIIEGDIHSKSTVKLWDAEDDAINNGSKWYIKQTGAAKFLNLSSQTDNKWDVNDEGHASFSAGVTAGHLIGAIEEKVTSGSFPILFKGTDNKISYTDSGLKYDISSSKLVANLEGGVNCGEIDQNYMLISDKQSGENNLQYVVRSINKDIWVQLMKNFITVYFKYETDDRTYSFECALIDGASFGIDKSIIVCDKQSFNQWKSFDTAPNDSNLHFVCIDNTSIWDIYPGQMYDLKQLQSNSYNSIDKSGTIYAWYKALSEKYDTIGDEWDGDITGMFDINFDYHDSDKHTQVSVSDYDIYTTKYNDTNEILFDKEKCTTQSIQILNTYAPLNNYILYIDTNNNLIIKRAIDGKKYVFNFS